MGEFSRFKEFLMFSLTLIADNTFFPEPNNKFVIFGPSNQNF